MSTPDYNAPPTHVTITRKRLDDLLAAEAALRGISPFVLEDYFENCATPEFKAAVTAMVDALLTAP